MNAKVYFIYIAHEKMPANMSLFITDGYTIIKLSYHDNLGEIIFVLEKAKRKKSKLKTTELNE